MTRIAATDITDQQPSRRRTAPLLAAVSVVALVVAACGGDSSSSGASDEATGPTIPTDPASIIAASSTAMGDVQSVAFELARDGAPVYIDSFESISLNTATGQFTVPRSARALLEVEVNGSLTTELGAIALDDEIWLSNPVTGDFETLPPGYDIDPSLFFDPENGWKPLMANLTDVSFVGTEQIDGNDRYHITGTAPAEQVAIITARLVRNQDVDIDFWIQPVSGLVTRAEFSTATPGADDTDAIDWALRLFDYGADFDISPPANLTDGSS
jgi:lipoprotein LprG